MSHLKNRQNGPLSRAASLAEMGKASLLKRLVRGAEVVIHANLEGLRREAIIPGGAVHRIHKLKGIEFEKLILGFDAPGRVYLVFDAAAAGPAAQIAVADRADADFVH